MEKKRVIKSIENITEDVMQAIKKKYPDGWSNHVQRITKGNNEFMHVITVDTDDISYMIKVKVKVDSIEEVEKFTRQVDSGHDAGVSGDDDDTDTDEIPDVEDTDD
jgi:hypothetical protein